MTEPHTLQYGTILPAGLRTSMVIADFDFETYSPAGFVWNLETNEWDCARGASKKGLPVVGTAVYSEHADAEVLLLAYNLKDGKGIRQWEPHLPLPWDLFAHLANGKLIEAHNVGFERWIWNNVCIPKYGFPELPEAQLRCSAAKARAFALPGSLGDLSKVLDLKNKKDKEGERLIRKYCIPRNPTKKDNFIRIFLDIDILFCDDSIHFRRYNMQDVIAEAEVSSLIPDLNTEELKFWQIDQRINQRGIQIDVKSVNNAIDIIEQCYEKYNKELQQITNGEVRAASEVAKIVKWLQNKGLGISNLDDSVIVELLNNFHLTPYNEIRRVLKIRQMLASASVKKLYAMLNTTAKDGRVHDLFIYHSARTGRAAGAGIQPQNLPKGQLQLNECVHCNKFFIYKGSIGCPHCERGGPGSVIDKEWDYKVVKQVLENGDLISLKTMEQLYDNPIETIAGCLRGMFISKPGHDLICSDFSAIEAVVAAALAGEEWRLKVFRSHGKIYEMSASKITGMPFEEYQRYYDTHKKHHPDRKLGKVAELASGYQGWINAWKMFGADEFLTEDQIKQAILSWRNASPAIVEMWGGQERNWNPCYYGLEGAAIQAVMNPGKEYEYRGIKYLVHNNILYCRLLSGRYLTYHQPQLIQSTQSYREHLLQLTFMGWNTNPKNGGIGWIKINTWGGRLFENVVQAVARDILVHAIINLEQAGYPVVLHVHDEIVAEVPENFGSIEQFESIMSLMPDWANDWPIKAFGGWRDKRYRK